MAKKKITKFNRYRPDLARHAVQPTERELLSILNEDTRDAFKAVREIARRLGEQKVYNSAKAIMFARRVCFMFVRPKKSHLELSFFLAKQADHTAIRRSKAVSRAKFVHSVKLVHRDQVDARLAGWLKDAYAYSK